jgi:hypothetical protein
LKNVHAITELKKEKLLEVWVIQLVSASILSQQAFELILGYL